MPHHFNYLPLAMIPLQDNLIAHALHGRGYGSKQLRCDAEGALTIGKSNMGHILRYAFEDFAIRSQ